MERASELNDYVEIEDPAAESPIAAPTDRSAIPPRLLPALIDELPVETIVEASPNGVPVRRILTVVDRRDAGTSRKAVDERTSNTRVAIVKIRRAPDPAFVTNARVVHCIIHDLSRRGAFYHDENRSYVFLNDSRVLLTIDLKEEKLELVLADYGLYPNEELTKQVTHAIRLHARKYGRATQVHAFSYFNRRDYLLYVYDFAGGVFRLSAAGAEHMDNGADGVLFVQNPKWKAIELKPAADVDWQRWLWNGISFTDCTLTADDQRLLLAFWVLTLFFSQLFPTRMILALIGEKGSGKTSILRRLGRLLFGPRFDVMALTAKPDDFDAAVTNEPFVVADNADEAPNWFPDKLAVLATGGMIKRRVLYTTNRLGEFPIVANLAITSRTPNFRREDVAERILPLMVGRIDSYMPESARVGDEEDQRGEIVHALLADVQAVLVQLQKHGRTFHRTKFRMADFADFILKTAPVLSSTAEVEGLLGRLSSQQVAFASDDEPLLDLLGRWLVDEAHVNVDREITLADLGAELVRLERGRVPWDPNSRKSFGQYFRARRGTLDEFYEIRQRTGHGGTQFVSIRRRAGDFGGLGDVNLDSPSED